MKSAESVYQKALATVKEWLKSQANLLEEFPNLPKGDKGLVVYSNYRMGYRIILLPNGELAYYGYDSWEAMTVSWYDRETHYFSKGLLEYVEEAVKKQTQKVGTVP